ncbi:MAG TPA: helix-turn-helix domain-containing protein [Micromonosporaceae bacterium]
MTDRRQAERGAAGRQRRADAQRSIDAILDAALACAPSDGGFNMTAIARAAGVSRVTLYAHFPTREALVDAALRRAMALTAEAFDRLRLDEGPATEALDRMLRSSWRIVERHRNLYQVASRTLSPSELHAYHAEHVLGQIDALIARGQDTGEFRTDLPREWLVGTVYTLMHLAAEQLNAGQLTAAQAGDVVSATVVSLLRRGSAAA